MNNSISLYLRKTPFSEWIKIPFNVVAYLALSIYFLLTISSMANAQSRPQRTLPIIVSLYLVTEQVIYHGIGLWYDMHGNLYRGYINKLDKSLGFYPVSGSEKQDPTIKDVLTAIIGQKQTSFCQVTNPICDFSYVLPLMSGGNDGHKNDDAPLKNNGKTCKKCRTNHVEDPQTFCSKCVPPSSIEATGQGARAIMVGGGDSSEPGCIICWDEEKPEEVQPLYCKHLNVHPSCIAVAGGHIKCINCNQNQGIDLIQEASQPQTQLPLRPVANLIINVNMEMQILLAEQIQFLLEGRSVYITRDEILIFFRNHPLLTMDNALSEAFNTFHGRL